MDDVKQLNDERLVDYIRTKNQEAYHEIMTRYQNKLLRYATHLVNNEEEAKDVVQNSFIKAFVNLNSFNIAKNFSSWIYRIVHNEAMNVIAKRKYESPIEEGFDIADENKRDAQNNLEQQEIKEMAHRCFSEMPILYSEPLSLFYLEEKSYEEISDILRIPIGTVGTRINRAKILMKKICQKKRI